MFCDHILFCFQDGGYFNEDKACPEGSSQDDNVDESDERDGENKEINESDERDGVTATSEVVAESDTVGEGAIGKVDKILFVKGIKGCSEQVSFFISKYIQSRS